MTQQLTLLGDGPLQQTHVSIETRLKTYFPETVFMHARLPARITQDIWNDLVRRTPFIGLSWLGWQGKGGGRLFRGAMKFGLYLVANNARPENLMMGDPTKPSLFGMGQLAAAVLQGFKTPHGSIEVTDIGNLFSESWGAKDQAIIGVNFQIDSVELTDPPAVEALDDFLRMQNTWHVNGEISRDTINVRNPS